MAWKIDRDYIDQGTPDSQVGTAQGELQGDTFTFRLRDDDDEIYYHGIADAASTENDGQDGGLYMALKWGEWFAGCTDLQVSGFAAIKYGLTSHSYLNKHNLKLSDWVSIYG